MIRTDGGRSPTPYAVTKVATEHRVQARAFPAKAGLDLDQMATATLKLGYQPHVFGPAGETDGFFLALKTYLRSGIPVVVRARIPDGDLHAFTLVGFREADKGEGDTGKELKIGSPHRTDLCSRGIARWYAHDDRLGPYARLPRYVGLIRWFLKGEWILDAVYDTTDLRRDDSSRPPLLALIPRNSNWIVQLENIRAIRFGDGPLIG